MNARNIDHYAEVLRERRVELQNIIVANQRTVREQIAPDRDTPADSNHPADIVSSSGPDYEKTMVLLHHERAELTLVNQALARIEQGRYGQCESCEGDIAVGRLEALPFARYCIKCQSREAARARSAAPAYHVVRN